MYRNPTSNKIVVLNSINAVCDMWPFMLTGLEELRKPSKAREATTPTDFLATLMRIVTSHSGVIMVLTSKNNKPIGFVVAQQSVERCSIQLVAAFINDKCPDALMELRDALEEWSREHGFKEIRAYTRRINGSAMRWYEKRLGFQREFVGFVKTL